MDTFQFTPFKHSYTVHALGVDKYGREGFYLECNLRGEDKSATYWFERGECTDVEGESFTDAFDEKLELALTAHMGKPFAILN